MTKEELKKEAEEYATKRASKLYTRNMWDRYYQTYIDSAKPREKRIADFEKENKVLAQNLEDTEIVNKALEKENAELKVSCKIQVDTAFQMIYEKDDQLAKAKEIINKLIELVEFLNEDNVEEPIIAEAEQFISEVEK